MKVKKIDKDKYNKPFPSRLRQLLDNENNVSPLGRAVTQTELSRAFCNAGMSVTRQTISLYANGETKPDIEKFMFIADFFQVSYDFLLGKADVPQREYIDIAKATGLTSDAIEALKQIKTNFEEQLDEEDPDYRWKCLLRDKDMILNYIINEFLTEDSIWEFSRPIFDYIEQMRRLNEEKEALLILEDLINKHGTDVINWSEVDFPDEIQQDILDIIMFKKRGLVYADNKHLGDAIYSIDRDIKFEGWLLAENQKEFAIRLARMIMENYKEQALLYNDSIRVLYHNLREGNEHVDQTEES